MCKQKLIIFACLMSLTTLSGCGLRGPLYQTPATQTEKNIEPTEKNTQSTENSRNDQQEQQ